MDKEQGGFFAQPEADGFFPSPLDATQSGFSAAPVMSGTIAATSMMSSSAGGIAGEFSIDNEPPLLEELEINFPHIMQKTKAVLNPFGRNIMDTHIMDDTDLAGPLIYCLLFGFTLLLMGKVHFGYIFGLGSLACLALWGLLNLMTENGADLSTVVSVLGYSMLPIVLLAVISLFVSYSTHGIIAYSAATLAIGWCTYSSSLMFVRSLNMSEQRLLIAYPIALVYASFGVLSLF